MSDLRETRQARTEMSRRHQIGIAVVVLVIVFLIGLSVGADDSDIDCPQIRNQRTAQAIYDRDPSDPHKLDADNDGRACEGRPK